MDEWIGEYAAWVIDHRQVILRSFLVLNLVAVSVCYFLKFDSSLEVWFLANDPNIVNYRKFQQQFGRDELVLVGLESTTLFENGTMKTIAEVTNSLESLKYVDRVLSLTNIKVLQSREDGIAYETLYSPSDWVKPAAEELRRRAVECGFVSRFLLSQDGSATVLVLNLTDACADAERHIELAGQVRNLVRPLEKHGHVTISGIPFVNDAMFRLARRDLVVLSPLVLLIIWGMAWFLYRSWLAALQPLAMIGFSLLMAFTLMVLLGWRVNFLVSALTLAIIVVAIVNAIHIMSAWYEQSALGRDRKTTLIHTIQVILFPSFMTNVSTCVGFLSLVVCDIRPIRQFGILAAWGTFWAFIASVVVLPVLLEQHRVSALASRKVIHSPTVDRWLQWLGQPTAIRRRWILAISTCLIPVSLLGIWRLRSTANPLSYFRSEEQIRRDTEALDRLFQGTCSLEFRVEAADGGMSQRMTLSKVDRFQGWLRSELGVLHPLSILEFLKDAEQLRSGSDQGTIPRRNLRALLVLMRRKAPEVFYDWLDESFSVGRISARLPLTRADFVAAQVPKLESVLKESYAGEDLRIESTGYVKLINNMRLYLLRSQIQSLFLAALGVTVMMVVMLGSWKLGILSMIPNLLPVAIGMAMMGFLDIRLDPGTIMIGSIASGLVVDDTCHFLSFIQRECRRGLTLPDAIAKSMLQSGRAIVLTSLILAAGFAGLGLGSFAPTIYFGFVMSFIIVVALAAELLLMPAVLLWLHKPQSTDNRADR